MSKNWIALYILTFKNLLLILRRVKKSKLRFTSKHKSQLKEGMLVLIFVLMMIADVHSVNTGGSSSGDSACVSKPSDRMPNMQED